MSFNNFLRLWKLHIYISKYGEIPHTVESIEVESQSFILHLNWKVPKSLKIQILSFLTRDNNK